MQFVEFAKLHRAKTEGSYMREHSMVRRGRKGGREGGGERGSGGRGREEGGRERVGCCESLFPLLSADHALSPGIGSCDSIGC